MKILKLTASNFKKLRCVEIAPDGHVVTITGKNGAGKSSVLDSIVTTLGGKNVAPKKPIRDGEEKAVIVIETEDITVTRKFTTSGSYLEVTNKEGFKAPSPQAVLDKLVGAIAFDPLIFTEKSDREQREILIALMGVDLSVHDQKIAALTEHRRQLLVQKKEAELDLSRLPKHTDVPVEEVSIMALVAQLHQANAANQKYDEVCERATWEKNDLVSLKEDLKNLQAKIARLEKIVQATETELASRKWIDVTDMERQADEFAATNRKVRENQAWSKAQAGIDKLAEQINADFQRIKQAEADKSNTLASVKLPLDGLLVDENGVTYHGIPLSQVNNAMKLQVSMAIGMALNPKLKVMLINGNGLDSDSLKTVTDMAAAKDYQVWMERVDDTGKVGVTIEDGNVVAVNGKPTKKQQAPLSATGCRQKE